MATEFDTIVATLQRLGLTISANSVAAEILADLWEAGYRTDTLRRAEAVQRALDEAE